MYEYVDLFCNGREGVLPCTIKGFHEIKTGDALPVKKNPYRVPYALREEMCKLLQVKRINSTSFNPQMQGMVETFHSGLNKSMGNYVNKFGNDWDEFVNYALMAHRAVPHSITRHSPFYLLYGREMRLPTEDDLSPEKGVTTDGANRRDSVQYHKRGPIV
jgi:hypothetical protein